MSGSTNDRPVLVLNAGSSSLKYQLLLPETGEVQARGLVERIGEPGSDVADHAAALRSMAERLRHDGIVLDEVPLRAVGHRVVHGGPDFSEPVVIDDAVLDRIRELSALAPLHNPAAVTGIEAARERFDVPHVAVFDTAFFSSLPAEASTYAVPRDLATKHSIRRYGFHGTSHQYVAQATADLLDRPLGDLRQVILHLGNGCSASAVRHGLAVETSMGLTPLQGLVMGTRSGDVDPGLHAYLAREAGLSLDEIDTVLNKRSGLLGLSGVNDFRHLEQRLAAGEADARLAFDVVVHRIKHYVGAYLAILGGVDVLVFTAGVGGEQHLAAGRRHRGPRGARDHGRPGAQRRPVPAGPSHLTRRGQGRRRRRATNEELAIARQTADLVG